jgi:hypothetical protein
MARTRVAFAEKGVNSYQQDKELLVLISDTGWWYGYVARVDPSILTYKDRGEWVAILVKSSFYVEGETQEKVFRCIGHHWYLFGWYENCYSSERNPEDGLVQCRSFDNAVQNIGRMIKQFNYRLRMRSEPDDGFRLDLRCLNFFSGLGFSDEEMRVVHDMAELPIIDGARQRPENSNPSVLRKIYP